MIKKKWILNVLYLAITLTAFSISSFRMNNPVWIAAWIAPVFMIRFIRSNKWVLAVVSAFIVLQIAVFAGILPFMNMIDTASVKTDFSFMLIMQIRSGFLLMAPLFLIPFILDKTLYNKLPKFAGSLVYPSGVVAMDFLISLSTGVFNTFAESQYTLQPLVMTSSIFGVFGLSFLVAWSAPMVNYLWEEKWNIRNLGYSGLIYITITAVMFIYGSIMIAFPQKAVKNVPIAGI